jgi:mono/diheme cytochrome c family protein
LPPGQAVRLPYNLTAKFRLVETLGIRVLFEADSERNLKLMKLIISVIVTIIVASSGAAFAADGAALWAQNCASCHGKDGSGNTTMGKKLGVKDYSKSQSFSDAEAANVIKNGKGKMKAYKQLSDADVKALVAYVRSLKK